MYCKKCKKKVRDTIIMTRNIAGTSKLEAVEYCPKCKTQLQEKSQQD